MLRIGKKRRSDPALYELFMKDISPRAVGASVQPPGLKPKPEKEPKPQLEPQEPLQQPEPESKLTEEQEATTVAASSSDGFSWLSPGRSLRVPIGYIFLTIAAVFVVIIGTFIFGHLRGGQDKEREFGDFGPLNKDGGSPIIAQDPMGQDSQPIIMGGGERYAETSTFNDSATGTAGFENSSARSEWGAIESDPRQEGYNYYILIHTTRENARKLAQFCRDERIRAYVVRPGRMNQYQVFVLPGYLRGGSNSAEIIWLKSRLKAVTRKWNLHVNSRDDLSYYPERYDG